MKDGKRKLTIIIEEDGSQGGKGFNLYLDGDKDRIGQVPERELSPAEFWGSRLFMICVNAVRGAGAVTSEHDRTKPQ